MIYRNANDRREAKTAVGTRMPETGCRYSLIHNDVVNFI
jgi:hypothetical protein